MYIFLNSQKWNNKEHIPEFQLPQYNEFLPENLDLYPLEEAVS
jgi:secreted Zn-dependent insulinase-like peptidase